MTYELLHGDCLEAMAAIDAGSVDAVVTDPPYLLGFMGKQWDKPRAAQEWHYAWATFAFRALRPSHYLLAFGGTRTWHRLACAIEDAGFEIRDTLMWLYGSGFPKGKSCLKPAWEPIILARKPGPMQELGIEECRIPSGPDHAAKCASVVGLDSNRNGNDYGEWTGKREDSYSPAGRWPANLILECTCDETREGTAGRGAYVQPRPTTDAGGASWSKGEHVPFHYGDTARIHTDPNCPCAMLDGQTGTCRSSCNEHRSESRGGEPGFSSGKGFAEPGVNTYSDSGGASRFFYQAKAPRAERWGYCQTCATVYPPKERTQHSEHETTMHPTQKPESLMRWLVRLVARPGDVVVDPFAGSGTTGVACAEEGREFIGIEQDAEYIEIARRRIDHASAQGRLPLDESPPLPPVAGRPT